MILMGDEIGRTQRGNNNAYCHDNDLSWMDWTLLKSNGDLGSSNFASRPQGARRAAKPDSLAE